MNFPTFGVGYDWRYWSLGVAGQFIDDQGTCSFRFALMIGPFWIDVLFLWASPE